MGVGLSMRLILLEWRPGVRSDLRTIDRSDDFAASAHNSTPITFRTICGQSMPIGAATARAEGRYRPVIPSNRWDVVASVTTSTQSAILFARTWSPRSGIRIPIAKTTQTPPSGVRRQDHATATRGKWNRHPVREQSYARLRRHFFSYTVRRQGKKCQRSREVVYVDHRASTDTAARNRSSDR